MSGLVDALIARNPLLGHGPRTHATGIVLVADTETAPGRRPRPLVIAPKTHLGRAGRAA